MIPEELNYLFDQEEVMAEDDGLNFKYYFDEEVGKWVLPQKICQLGGCDTDFIEFDSEQEAYEKALELTKEGKCQEVGYPCADCYRDYMQG